MEEGFRSASDRQARIPLAKKPAPLDTPKELTLLQKQTGPPRSTIEVPNLPSVRAMELCKDCASLCADWLKAVDDAIFALEIAAPGEVVVARQRAESAFARYDNAHRSCRTCKP